jgi:nicotinamide riboside transporter PnuC
MIASIYILFQLIAIGFYDCWQMAKKELRYWAMLNVLEPYAPPDKVLEAEAIKSEASEAISIGQFIFWYAEIVITLLYLLGLSLNALYILVAIMLLHYFGAEDVMFFIWSNVIPLPESWWKNKQKTKIFGLVFPTELPWLARNRSIGSITIGRKPFTAFVGENVDAKKLVILDMFLFTVTFILFIFAL